MKKLLKVSETIPSETKKISGENSEKISKRILFVYRAEDRESLGIEYLSSMLRNSGHKTALIIYYEKENFKRRLIKRIKEFNPDFICFSVVTDNYHWSSEMAKLVKKNTSAPIVFGGIQVTSCPEEVISRDFVDFIVVGEGEHAILELVENPKKENIKNVWLKKNGKIIKNSLRPLVDLNSLPFPDKELFYNEAPYLKFQYVCMTSRGCPFNCSFCFNCHLKELYKNQKWFRRLDVERIIDELKTAKKKFNYLSVRFDDDCFTANKEWLKNFLREYIKEINVPFNMASHSIFIDEEVAFLLKKAGCLEIEIGVQSPIERIRKDICKRNDSNGMIINAVRAIKKYKLELNVDHIFCLPSEKVSDYWEGGGLNFYIGLRPTRMTNHILQYYPNTEIVEIGKKYGEITEEDMNEIVRGDYKNTTFNMYKIDPKKVRRIDERLIAISNFLCWTPLLPMGINYHILKKRSYLKLFKSPMFRTLNKLTLIIPHLYSSVSLRYFWWTRKSRMQFHVSRIKARYEK